MSRRESRRETRQDVGGDGGLCSDVAATVEVAALIGKNNARGRFISCSRQLVGWTCSARRIRGTNQPYADRCSHGREDGDWKSANQQRRVPISNRRAGLEVLGERDVSWKESRHEARQEVTGASVIEVLLLPEMSRDERASASVKFEQIPLFYPRG